MHTRAFAAGTRTRRPALASGLLVAILLLGASGAQARITVSPNFRLGTKAVVARGEDAVGMAVDRRNPAHIVEVNADWTAGQCDFHVTFDSGRTWKGGHFRAPAGFSPVPCTVGPHLAEHMQAGVAYGSAGNVYATFASPRPLPGANEEGKSLLVVKSRDGGRTWGTASVVAVGGPSATQGPNYALPTIGVDPARRGSPRRDRIYVAAASTEAPEAQHEGSSNENVRISTSEDGGATWSPIANVNTPDENAIEQSRPVVGHDGAVYVAWRDRGRGTAPNTFVPDGFIVVAKSRDRGRTWSRVQTAPVHGYTYAGAPTPLFAAGAAFTGSSFPRLAIDPKRNDVYLVYGQGPAVPGGRPGHSRAIAHAADHFINPDQDVYFQRSTDGGATWSPPRALNTAPPIQTEITQTRHPWVSVAPNGRVDIVWEDRRHWYRGCTNTHVICDEARLGDTYYTYSTNHGASFTRNYRLSDRSSNNDVGFDYRFGTGWAYGPVVVPQGDNGLLVAWMDSRLGNVENDTQDIYLTRVRIGGKGPAPVTRLPRRSPADFSVALSRLAYPGGPEAVLNSTFVTRPFTRVVIANQRDASGVLAGGVLARANLAPVLVSPAAGLTPAVKAEVARMKPVGAYVVGSEKALSPQVVSDLAAAGVPADQIVRIAGANTADTAARIAAAADRRKPADVASGRPAFNAAIVTDLKSPDAATAAVLAANRRLPVLYVSRDSVPQATADALKSLTINQTLVVGGPGVVSQGVLSQLPGAKRLGGADAYATSQAVLSESRRRGVPDNVVYTTDGTRAVETALLGASVGRIGGLQLVSRGGAPAVVRAIAQSKTLREAVTRVVAVEK